MLHSAVAVAWEIWQQTSQRPSFRQRSTFACDENHKSLPWKAKPLHTRAFSRMHRVVCCFCEAKSSSNFPSYRIYMYAALTCNWIFICIFIDWMVKCLRNVCEMHKTQPEYWCDKVNQANGIDDDDDAGPICHFCAPPKYWKSKTNNTWNQLHTDWGYRDRLFYLYVCRRVCSVYLRFTHTQHDEWTVWKDFRFDFRYFFFYYLYFLLRGEW